MTTIARRTRERTSPRVRGARVALTASAATGTGRAFAVVAVGASIGMLVSGFWNVRAVDGLGLAIFVTPVIGAFEGKAAAFAAHGPAFGLLFSVLAGLAATCTASNVAGFTMVPALLATNAQAERPARVAPLLTAIASSAAAAGVLQGVWYGRLGPEGAAAFHTGPIRSAQSFTVFGALGVVLLGWAVLEAGLAARVTSRIGPAVRTAARQPMVLAVLTGAVIGLFSIGRPLAVFREALLYAAQPASVEYAAFSVALAVLATTFGVSLSVAGVSGLAGSRLTSWMQERPQQVHLLAAGALAAGGSFLIFYWAVTRIWPVMGRWGFALGWYA